MSGNPQENHSSGRLARTATKAVGPVAVDCNGWDAEVPAEQWSSGKLVRLTRSQPVVEGAFTPAGSLDLEITLQLEPEVNPARAFTLAAQLLAVGLGFDPGLGLICDPAQSRTEEGRVVIVLTASRPGPDAEARLEKVAEVIRIAGAETGGIALNEIRVLRTV